MKLTRSTRSPIRPAAWWRVPVPAGQVPGDALPGLALLAAAWALKLPRSALVRADRSAPIAWMNMLADWLLADVCAWPHAAIDRARGRSKGSARHAVAAVIARLETEPAFVPVALEARGLFFHALNPQAPQGVPA